MDIRRSCDRGLVAKLGIVVRIRQERHEIFQRGNLCIHDGKP